jgi:hypothetical protein
MTSQIVEEQTDFVEEKIKEFEKYRDLFDEPHAFEKVESFIRSLASTLIDRVSKDVKKMRLKHKDYERHVHIYTNEGTGKCHICQMSWKESTRQGIYNQALSDVCTKLQEMK